MINKLWKILAIVLAVAVIYFIFIEKQRYHAKKLLKMIRGTHDSDEVLAAGRKGCRSLFDDDYLGI